MIPHELTHLVFNTAIDNPYHAPPRWLNEGLAVYLSEGYTPAWRSAVTSAVGSGGVIPLDGLIGQFPTTADQFLLAYGESVAAVDFMIRHVRQAGPGQADPLVQRWGQRRRGLQRGAGRGHRRIQFRLAEGPGGGDAQGLWTAAGAGRAGTGLGSGSGTSPGPRPTGPAGQSLDSTKIVVAAAAVVLVLGLVLLLARSRRRASGGLP